MYVYVVEHCMINVWHQFSAVSNTVCRILIAYQRRLKVQNGKENKKPIMCVEVLFCCSF